MNILARCSLLVALAVLIVPVDAFSGTCYVDNDNTTGPWDGTSWATAFDTIQPAIDAAYAQNTSPLSVSEVWVAEGVYREPRTSLVAHDGGQPIETGSLVMKDGVHLFGGFVGIGANGNETRREQRNWTTHECIVDGSISRSGQAAYHVVVGARGVLDGFTITGGNNSASTMTGCGGGMYVENVDITIRNCVFRDNSVVSLFGGGLYADTVTGTVANCVFHRNHSGRGGGGALSSRSSLTFVDCTFSENTAEWWGGTAGYGSGAGLAYNSSQEQAPITGAIIRCTFFGNSSLGGGALDLNVWKGQEFVIDGCRFLGDAAWEGSELYVYWTHPVISNSVFVGGTVYAQSSSPVFVNCTFSPDTGFRGILNTGFTFRNSILWNPSGTSPIDNDPASTFVDHCDISQTYTGDGNFCSDPMFKDPLHNDFSLTKGSPCIDAGTGTGAPQADIDGNPRPFGAGFDLGAYEFLSFNGMFNDPVTGQGVLLLEILSDHFPELTAYFAGQNWTDWKDVDLEHLDEVIAGTRPSAGDGIPDEYQMALVEYVLSNSYLGMHDCVLHQFFANKALVVADLQWLGANVSQEFLSLAPVTDLIAAMLGLSQAMQGTINNLTLFMTGGVSGLPHFTEYHVFGVQCGAKTASEPFSADGDFDRDGISNIVEFQQVRNAGGTPNTFAVAATDPYNFWPGNPALPVTGTLALGLILAVVISRSRHYVRRA